jgi:hypothetical protein
MRSVLFIFIEAGYDLHGLSHLVPKQRIGVPYSDEQTDIAGPGNMQQLFDPLLLKPADHAGSKTKLHGLQAKMGRSNPDVNQRVFLFFIRPPSWVITLGFSWVKTAMTGACRAKELKDSILLKVALATCSLSWGSSTKISFQG